ncbi:MAG: hypothetical protein H6626_14725 [Pseudobdellovibrionaceae bacterium]|nr:hypothetical protein [Bdellovibrionales bacterium]USN47418.1 MAG: hypothetical protein H6626_14725 [Pseudobdellovibrionaceae bacterium]
MKSPLGRWKKAVVLLGLTSLVAACGYEYEDDDTQPAPHTGNSIYEKQVSPFSLLATPANPGRRMYVYASRLRVRSTPEINEDNIVGILSMNDEVEIIKDGFENSFVEIAIITTSDDVDPAPHYYVSNRYLADKQVQEVDRVNSPYFMIQNVATEKLRIYERSCASRGCIHKMVLEADLAVGEKTRNRQTMTVMGNFNIMSWHKFYQDAGALYPSWYDPTFPSLPQPGASLTSWLSKDLLPAWGGSLRGAFGWYTAKVGPDARYQWTHGTFGWGEDKKKFIEATRGFWANLFADPRSHGCSRTDNESIAYVRHLLPVGSPIIKVYAKEAYADSQLRSYSQSKQRWEYILTKNGVRQDGQKPDRQGVLSAGTPSHQWLEEGTYQVNAWPQAKAFREGSFGATSGENGNVYALDDDEMRGVFLIDQGRLINYRHPSNLGVGGYKDQLLPSYVIAESGLDYTLPEPPPTWNDEDDEYDYLK